MTTTMWVHGASRRLEGSGCPLLVREAQQASSPGNILGTVKSDSRQQTKNGSVSDPRG